MYNIIHSIACFYLVSISAHHDAAFSLHHTKASDVSEEDCDCVSWGYDCVVRDYDYDFFCAEPGMKISPGQKTQEKWTTTALSVYSRM